MKRRIITGLVAGGIVAGSVFGLAAGLDLTSSHLGTGSATVTACDTNGIDASYTVSGSDVTAVVLGNVATACSGADATVTVSGASGVLATKAVENVDASGGTFTATLSSSVPIADVTGVATTLVGP